MINESARGRRHSSMTSIDNTENSVPRHSGMADLIVKGAIVLITAAFFVAAYLQLQMSFWAALIGAGSVYTILLMVHALKRRSERESQLAYEVNRLEDEIARIKVAPSPEAPAVASRLPKMGRPSGNLGVPPAATAAKEARMEPAMQAPAMSAPSMPPLAMDPPPPLPAAATKAPRIFRAASEVGSTREPRISAQRPGLDRPAFDADAGEPPLTAPRPEPSLSAPLLDETAEPKLNLRAEAKHPDMPPIPTLPDWSMPGAMPAPSAERKAHDYWPNSSKPTLPEAPRSEPPSLQLDRETDLDAVHGMIKRLADEVNIAEPTLDGLPPQRQESVLRASLNALQTTANAMRTTKKKDGLPPASPARPGAPTPPPIMPSHARLAALAEAVASGRVDVTLSPIVGLADHQLHYYEVVVCPRDERGTVLSTTARDPQLAIAGLLPLLDGARLRHAAQVARGLADDGRETCLFAPATAVSLANDSYLDELADAYRDREELANELVLTFAQADVRTFGGSEWSALTDMRDLGFRFGVEDVTDFDYEFTALCAAGFAFVKIDAATLLAGLAAPSGSMGAADVCRNLSELGLTLIVTNIDDEATRDKVLAIGVPLGQGALFGGPTTVAGNAFAAADDAAA